MCMFGTLFPSQQSHNITFPMSGATVPAFQKLVLCGREVPLTLQDEVSWRMGDFPGGSVVNNPPASAGDTGSIPGPGRFHRPRST